MRFELVRDRIASLPRELPAPPAILLPVRIDAPAQPVVPPAANRGRPAAVLVLLFPDDEGQARVLLTVRVADLAAHAGEVSFPGGSAEETDVDPAATALREAAEEVGLDAAACGLRIAGGLETFPLTVSGFRIVPVVALAERRPECRANPAEVARVFEAPVEAFLPDAPVELEERVIRERLIRYGVYPVEGERVWGATARMLGQLGAALATEPSEIPAAGAPAGGESDESAALDMLELEDAAELIVRSARVSDGPAIDRFLRGLAPELARALPPDSDTFVAELSGRIVALAGWADWDRPRGEDDPRGFEGVAFDDTDAPAEFTLLAVALRARGRGVGRRLTDSVAKAAAADGRRRLLAWTLADSAVHPSSVAARAFFRSAGFVDLAIDRRFQAGGEDRLLLVRPLG